MSIFDIHKKIKTKVINLVQLHSKRKQLFIFRIYILEDSKETSSTKPSKRKQGDATEDGMCGGIRKSSRMCKKTWNLKG